MDKKIKKRIEYAFYNYSELLKKSASEVVDLAYRNIAISYDKVAVKSSGGLSMQDKICALIDKTSTYYRWAMVVEKTIEHFAWDARKELIIKKYFLMKKEVEICLKLGICRSTYFYWIDNILDIAYHWAIELGVLKNET